MDKHNSKPLEPVQMHLEDKQKRFAEVKDHSIFFKQVQVDETLKVNVHRKPMGTTVHMAFSFRHRNIMYVLAVEDNTVKLKEKKETIPRECFLQWKSKKLGEWGILESVAHPNKFLYIQNDTVTVSSETELNKVSLDHCLFRLQSSHLADTLIQSDLQ